MAGQVIRSERCRNRVHCSRPGNDQPAGCLCRLPFNKEVDHVPGIAPDLLCAPVHNRMATTGSRPAPEQENGVFTEEDETFLYFFATPRHLYRNRPTPESPDRRVGAVAKGTRAPEQVKAKPSIISPTSSRRLSVIRGNINL